MSTAREELARRQEALLAALVAGGPVPDGFDPERIRIQAGALLAKRRDGVLRAMPDLPDRLGDAWPGAFAAWARTHPKPAEGGSRADAAAFAEHARREGLFLTEAPERPRRPWWRRLPTGRRSTGENAGAVPSSAWW